MIKSAFFCNNSDNLNRVYAKGRKDTVAKLTDLYPEVITDENFNRHADKLKDIEVIFSTWGMPALNIKQIDLMPNLKAVFYAAGSVKGFAKPFLEKGISVISSWAANAIPVAEFTLSQVLLSTKGYFKNIIDRKTKKGVGNYKCFRGYGNFGETISIIGCGAVGSKVVELLKKFNLNIIVYDPYLDINKAKEMKVEKVTLKEAFKRGYVVSNHAPNIPKTKGMLDGKLFNMMRENAVFINTGRGATVKEDEMIEVLKKRPDLTALLDVTHPEPPKVDSELYNMPNVYISGHIAGSLGDEVVRMADFSIEEFKAYTRGDNFSYSVSKEDLNIMA